LFSHHVPRFSYGIIKASHHACIILPRPLPARQGPLFQLFSLQRLNNLSMILAYHMAGCFSSSLKMQPASAFFYRNGFRPVWGPRGNVVMICK
jgi:hypothetical protein